MSDNIGITPGAPMSARDGQFPDFGAALADTQLPFADLPTVTLTAEHLRRFRDAHALLLRFAADVTGADVRRLCWADLEKWRGEHGLPLTDPLWAYLAANPWGEEHDDA